MEDLGPSRFEGIGTTFRKRRTNTSRRPKPESQPPSEGRDISSLSSTPPSDDTRAGSSDENSGGGGHSSRRKELSLSQCVSRFPAAGVPEDEKPVKKGKKVDVGLDELYGNNGSEDGTSHRRSSEGVLAPANWKNTSRVTDGSEPQKTMALSSIKTDEGSVISVDAPASEGKLRKLKVKVGGVTRTIDANSFGKCSDAGRMMPVHKDASNDTSLPPADRKRGLQGIPWKDFSRGGFSLGREESSMRKGNNAKNSSSKQGDKSDSARKSKRAPKKRAIDGFDDDDDDDEIRYLEKLKNARLASGIREDDEEPSRKHRRLSKFAGNSPENLEGSVSSKDGGKKRSPSEDTDYEEEEDALSEGEQESRKKKKAKKDPIDAPVTEPKREMTLTTRQRALQSGRDATGLNGNGIEFPNGLPPAPPKKQKEKLSEVDQQLKKAEAAHRRRLQNEKAARESEAEAIRRILGQDSSRKKREEKKRKREEELAQEKAADELARASNSVRLVMGPNGTTVTFPIDMGLPSIFESKPYSYPPPREKCAGPSCSNPYKYRDSKTKLPLCSLGCYKAVQGNLNNQTASC